MSQAVSFDPTTGDRVKPRFRGVSHQVAFFAAIGACAALVLVASGTSFVTVAVIYGTTLITLFGISALYHRPMWSPRARELMRRLDHASIFVFIAGSYTPICLLAMPPEHGRWLLIFAWCFAAVGVIHAIFFVHAFRTFNAVLFVAMGCAALPFVGDLAAGMGAVCVGLIIAGGAIYIAGAVVYARRWPDPNPRVFGYHEVFHLMVILAGALHYAAMMTMFLRAAEHAALA